MGLNCIYISGWQEGIDLSAVAADFVIMKATQGTGFISKDFARQYQQAKENGKLVGCYHYAEGGDYVAEANHFLDVVRNCVGEAILCLDWEGQDNPTFGKDDFNWCVCCFIWWFANVDSSPYWSNIGPIESTGNRKGYCFITSFLFGNLDE